MLKGLQERLLHRVLSLVEIPDHTDQCPVHSAVVAVDQIFKSVQVAALRPRHQPGVRVNLYWLRGALRRGETMRIVRSKPAPWDNVRCRTEAHLKGIEEGVKGCDHYALQNVLVGKAVVPNPIDVMPSDAGRPSRQLEGELQQRRVRLWEVGHMV